MGVDRLLSHRHSQVGFFNRSIGFFNLLTAIIALLMLYTVKTKFWELTADGLRLHRLGIEIKIKWQDVTRVVSVWASTYDLKIEYLRHGLGSKTGFLLASPEDREDFVAELRRYAPDAEFVDESQKKILTV